jgi:D-alanyl-lipoteichoic acid acyltransferase DltB (MBOAT superfamily)
LGLSYLCHRLIGLLPTFINGPEPVGDPVEAARRDRVDLGRFTVVVIQLVLLALAIYEFQIENRAFYVDLMALTCAAFVVHHFLPFRYRLPFFLIVSFLGIGVIFGFRKGAVLIGIGLILVGICHLPILLRARVAILAIVGIFLAVLRAGRLDVPGSSAIWPILGSMFMFRLILYMYDLAHSKERTNVPRVLAYFFLLPNVCFPLFPVVDYSAFRRTYYDTERYLIYQRGIQWMLRGLIQIILYRIVYHYITISSTDVATTSDLIRYIVSSYMLYLRISGGFHLVIGILHLFGFNLPETNHRYFLASSIADLWRRGNIYWRDFMQKVIYYPFYFRLRRMGPTPRLVIPTLAVCLATWGLHSYQWFWLRGSFLFSWTDVTFWTIMGLLLVASSLREAKHGRQRASPGRQTGGLSGSARRTLSTVGTFSVMCLLFSLWFSPSVPAWLDLWSVVGSGPDPGQSWVPALAVAGLATEGSWWSWSWRWPWRRGAAGKRSEEPPFLQLAGQTGALTSLLLLIGNPVFYERFGTQPQAVIGKIRGTELNMQDATLLQRGYYENLAGVAGLNAELFELYVRQQPDQPRLLDSVIVQFTNNFLRHELRPSLQVVYGSSEFHTNSWGMHDRYYDREKPTGAYRIALLGPSDVMGMGVRDSENFEWLLEDRLNRENRGPYSKYEILNFAVGSYSLLQELMTLETKALSFSPDTMMVVSHPHEREIVLRHLAERYQKGVEPPWDYLRDVASAAGVTPGMEQDGVVRRFKPHIDDTVDWAFRRIVALCRERAVRPVWIYLPSIEGEGKDSDSELADMARDAGFIVIDMTDVFDDYDRHTLSVNTWDFHPNQQGHRLIAGRLYDELREHDRDFSLGLDPPTQAGDGPVDGR